MGFCCVTCCDFIILIAVGRQPWGSTLRQRQNGRHFADVLFKCVFLKENMCVVIEISLKFIPEGPIDNKSALVQVMAWHLLGAKALSEPILTHIYDISRQQKVNVTHTLKSREILIGMLHDVTLSFEVIDDQKMEHRYKKNHVSFKVCILPADGLALSFILTHWPLRDFNLILGR